MTIEIKNSIVSDVVGTLYDKMGVNDYTSPKKVKAQLKDCAFSNDLIVNVSSGGGDVFAASEIYTMLRDSGKKVMVGLQLSKFQNVFASKCKTYTDNLVYLDIFFGSD